MLLVWLKVLVGLLLMGNFSIPLVAICRDRRLREDPMPLLVFNLALADFAFGALIFSIGVLDAFTSENVPPLVCASIQYLLTGSALAFKAATVYLAVDQFVAIVHSLHYRDIMGDWMPRIFLATWGWIPFAVLYGFISHLLEMETLHEFDQRTLGTQGSVKECRLTQRTFVVAVFFEATLTLMSFLSAALFVYTATKGFQQERRNNRRRQVDETSLFFLRFKSFKRIVKVLLTLLTADIIGAGFRIGSRFLPQMPVFQLGNLVRVLSIIVEAWTYGLSYPAVRSAIRELLCGRVSQQIVQQDPAVRQPTENGIRELLCCRASQQIVQQDPAVRQRTENGIREFLCCHSSQQIVQQSPVENGIELPDGGIELPDGGIELPDGGIESPDGDVEPPDGDVELALRPEQP